MLLEPCRRRMSSPELAYSLCSTSPPRQTHRQAPKAPLQGQQSAAEIVLGHSDKWKKTSAATQEASPQFQWHIAWKEEFPLTNVVLLWLARVMKEYLHPRMIHTAIRSIRNSNDQVKSMSHRVAAKERRFLWQHLSPFLLLQPSPK